MSNLHQIRIGLSQTFPCSYIDNRNETLLLCCDPVNTSQFEQLLQVGFRRSGDQIYRPHCGNCKACKSVRVLVEQYVPSRSQRRVINRNRDIRWQTSDTVKPEYRPLYHSYISGRHSDGSMYPPSDKQFDQFLLSSQHSILFLEGWLNNRLVAVAVTDVLPDSLSATYTFYADDLNERSLGKRAIIAQIELARAIKKHYLYLGYQIDECGKMAYKTEFGPAELYKQDRWLPFSG
ncbi:arginyltransferase [Ferrimonas lipolytica]|uniref:Aspartate/glutamate leucyltransferase n=1 Tax=Ferrimonas lipolytica TaxID=2724191 RepID=A0A6H1UCT8_9GAMM|nr:arginyltransferase [Ferrimonas lipolytica]QIZ76658.1 arginyltransferase [Ferrimonas lipolytica]